MNKKQLHSSFCSEKESIIGRYSEIISKKELIHQHNLQSLIEKQKSIIAEFEQKQLNDKTLAFRPSIAIRQLLLKKCLIEKSVYCVIRTIN